MRCSDISDLVIAYASGELAPNQAEFVQLHLDRCPDCQQLLQNLTVTRRKLEILRADQFQPDLSQKIMGAIARKVWLQRIRRWIFGSMVAAAIMAFALYYPQASAPVVGEHLLAVSPDQRIHYVLRADPSGFVIDRVDQRTGAITRDQAVKPGSIQHATITPDGKRLLLVGTYEGATYLKVIATDSLSVQRAFLLPGFPAETYPQVSPTGAWVLVLADGLAARFNLAGETRDASAQVAGISPTAALSPDGQWLVTANPQGGLLLLETAHLTVLRGAPGPVYTKLTWGPALLGVANGKKVRLDPATMKPSP
jgi:hypothetical protein